MRGNEIRAEKATIGPQVLFHEFRVLPCNGEHILTLLSHCVVTTSGTHDLHEAFISIDGDKSVAMVVNSDFANEGFDLTTDDCNGGNVSKGGFAHVKTAMPLMKKLNSVFNIIVMYCTP